MNKEKQALKKDIEVALIAAGFSKASPEKFTIALGREIEIFVYPRVASKRSHLELEGGVGFENRTLTDRLLSAGKRGADLRVCHTLLGSIREVVELWHGNFVLLVPMGQSNAPAVELFVRALQTIVFRKFSTYDSVEKVIELLRLYIEAPRQVDVVVADASEKLAILAAH